MSSFSEETDPELSGLAGLYALDALDDDERRRFEAHLAEDPAVAAEVEEFRHTAGRLAAASAHPPPASMRDTVLGSLGGIRQESPRLDDRRAARVARLRRVAVAAAAVLAVVGVGVGGFAVGRGSDTDAADTEVAAVAEVIGRPDAELVRLTGDDGREARVVVSVASGEVAVVADGLAQVDDDSTYELWTLRGDQASPAGRFRPDDDGAVRRTLATDLDGAEALAVTVEPAGGSETPTLPIVMSGELS